METLGDAEVKQYVRGWEQILNDKCNTNSLQDVMPINKPCDILKMANKDLYVYAGYLQPGYHQLLLFDPIYDKIFIKEFVVTLNEFDFYPEYPQQLREVIVKKQVPDVWRKWAKDSPEDVREAFTLHRVLSEDFQVKGYIKNEEDASLCLLIL